MSDLNTSPTNGATKRNLPSWMSSVSRQNASKPDGKKLADAGAHEENDEVETLKQAKGHGKSQMSKTPSKENERGDKSSATNLVATKFSKQLEGVVFVLSGFVNPERSVLRSQALEMGAEYQPDWNSDCTLLVCAFPNTPKFRQVEADCGTIVSKEWISECYNQKRVVDIDSYLMHAGKPWRRQSISHEASQDQESTASRKSQNQVERAAHSKPTTSASSKSIASNRAKDCFAPPKVKKWAIDDLSKTISWLESQEEKPEPSEIKKVAAEGILTCLQDAIDSLKQEQPIQQITEQWNFIPLVVEELVKLEGTGDGPGSLTKKDLYKQAMTCKEIYEVELGNLDNVSLVKNKKLKTNESDAPAYDSDETIEMTEEDIDQAYNVIASKLTPAC